MLRKRQRAIYISLGVMRPGQPRNSKLARSRRVCRGELQGYTDINSIANTSSEPFFNGIRNRKIAGSSKRCRKIGAKILLLIPIKSQRIGMDYIRKSRYGYDLSSLVGNPVAAGIERASSVPIFEKLMARI